MAVVNPSPLVRAMQSDASTAGTDQGPRRSVEELEQELAEAHRREAATAAVLRIISRSKTNVQPVFDTIVSSAVRLCNGLYSALLQFDGEMLHWVAQHNFTPKALEAAHRAFPARPTRGLPAGRVILERAVIHIPDIERDPEYQHPDLARAVGFRSGLFVPMLREGAPIGVIAVTRAEAGPFSDNAIELLKTFADQAVIAIENTRLFEAEQARTRELTESLEYQTATSEVLGAISRSANEVQPVLDTIVQTASRLCDAEFALIFKLQGGKYRVAAATNASTAFVRYASEHPHSPSRGSLIGRAALECRTVHLLDCLADPEYRSFEYQSVGKFRTMLGVPLLRDGVTIGVIGLMRTMVKPFTGKQIELVATFADQAVIAIENARLFEAEQASKRELQQSLEYQTATSEVLQVISATLGEVEPVFQAVLENATRLCVAKFGSLYLCEGDALRAVAMHDAPPAFMRARAGIIRPPPHTSLWTAINTKEPAQVADVMAEEKLDRSDPFVVSFSELGGFRSVLSVPMLKDEKLVGVISVYRPLVGPFTDKQIELVKNFASQAAIAIENTRLFEEVQARTTELTESLEYQTAISNVLGVISASPNDVRPAYQNIVETACRLCKADRAGVWRLEEGSFNPVARANEKGPLDLLPGADMSSLDRSSLAGRVGLDGRTVHIPDILADPEYDKFRSRPDDDRRSMLGVPLMRQGHVIGAIILIRTRLEPFSQAEIRLVETFADQAVIAIENTRLFEAEQASKRELQQSLEYQTATSEVLDVISRSPTDIQPVLDVVCQRAAKLCEANNAVIFRLEGELLRQVASYGGVPTSSHPTQGLPVNRDRVTGRAVFERETVHVHDLATADSDFPEGSKDARRDGHRTTLAIPLLREGVPLGAILIRRMEVRPFSDGQIKLLETFADQAVIAIENTRLFEAEQASKRELQESLGYQTAMSEILQVISNSLNDTQPVFDAIVQSGLKLFPGALVSVALRYGAAINAAAIAAPDPALVDAWRRTISRTPLARDYMHGAALLDCRIVDIPDVADAPAEFAAGAQNFLTSGNRAITIMPMMRGDESIGLLSVVRLVAGPLSDKQLAVLRTFANQAVIAIENTRLLNELRESLQQLEIASQHKSQFVANMSHELRTPLAAILGYAELIQEGFYGPQPEKSMDALTRIRSNGKHLLGLINTVLDIAKIEAGQFSLNLAEYALANVVETVCAATESLAETKKLVLTAQVARPLPIGFGDEQRLTQVLLNLVGNAIKFTDTGEVRITAKSENGHFAVSVADTGPGIPTDQLTRVFEQFHQVDNSNTKKKGGTGLGLAIAKQIVEMHGGRVWVESEPGKGATFQLQLPVRAESRKALQ